MMIMVTNDGHHVAFDGSGAYDEMAEIVPD